MPRIAGVDIPNDKRVVISLTYIHGIGPTFSRAILKEASNFLLWQIAYTELYVTEVLWPDFRKKDLHQALISYQKRERRFGKISEQVKL